MKMQKGNGRGGVGGARGDGRGGADKPNHTNNPWKGPCCKAKVTSNIWLTPSGAIYIAIRKLHSQLRCITIRQVSQHKSCHSMTPSIYVFIQESLEIAATSSMQIQDACNKHCALCNPPGNKARNTKQQSSHRPQVFVQMFLFLAGQNRAAVRAEQEGLKNHSLQVYFNSTSLSLQ